MPDDGQQGNLFSDCPGQPAGSRKIFLLRSGIWPVTLPARKLYRKGFFE
jgi:hypothetical protein